MHIFFSKQNVVLKSLKFFFFAPGTKSRQMRSYAVGAKDECILLFVLVWNVVVVKAKQMKEAREIEIKKDRRMKVCLLLLLMDPAKPFITPWTPAGVSYITAKPSLTDGHEWGEKNGSKILLDALRENKGGAVDGWVCLTQAGFFQTRQGVSWAFGPLLTACQPCQHKRHQVKLPPLAPPSLVSKQTLSIFNRWNSMWWEYRSFTGFMTALISGWGQISSPL